LLEIEYLGCHVFMDAGTYQKVARQNG
jgi:hypothetical protein